MNNIKKDITRCMSNLWETENGGLNASFVFPEDFIGFQGHFPEKKILPGVCRIQCIINMLETWEKKHVVLREVVMAKFLSPVSPSEELVCTCNPLKEFENYFIFRASFSKESGKVAEVKLKVSFDRGANEK